MNSFFQNTSSFFVRIYFCVFLYNICTKKYQLRVTKSIVNTKDKQLYVTKKKLSEETEWTFMSGFLNYIYVFVCGNSLAKTYCFLPSIFQLAMPTFFSAKYMFAMVPTERIQHKEFSFLPVSKAIKAVTRVTDFRVGTAIITFFVGGFVGNFGH